MKNTYYYYQLMFIDDLPRAGDCTKQHLTELISQKLTELRPHGQDEVGTVIILLLLVREWGMECASDSPPIQFWDPALLESKACTPKYCLPDWWKINYRILAFTVDGTQKSTVVSLYSSLVLDTIVFFYRRWDMSSLGKEVPHTLVEQFSLWETLPAAL